MEDDEARVRESRPEEADAKIGRVTSQLKAHAWLTDGWPNKMEGLTVKTGSSRMCKMDCEEKLRTGRSELRS